MPNHIKNRITFNTSIDIVEQIFQIFNTHVKATLRKSYDGNIVCENQDKSLGWFDLKTGLFHQRDKEDVLGLPEGYEMEISPARNVFPDFEKIIPPPDTEEYKAVANSENMHNSNNWYNWNRANWGTKWNSYEHNKEAFNVFTFETAWSGVPNLIKKMSESFPEVEILYEYADEDTGYNCGEITFLKGEIIQDITPKSGSKEAYELAFKLRPCNKEYYELVDGKYMSKDDA